MIALLSLNQIYALQDNELKYLTFFAFSVKAPVIFDTAVDLSLRLAGGEGSQSRMTDSGEHLEFV